MASNPPPAAAAGRAASAPSEDSDEMLARKWAALEQLTQVYGFDLKAAETAIEVVGPHVENACSFILDSGLGQDQGGSVVPIDNCPHLEQHARITPDNLAPSTFDPSSTVCTHFQQQEDAGDNKNKSATRPPSSKGQAKVEIDDDTGMCASTENWLCLHCGAIRCSRYCNGHGLVHWEDTKNSSDDGVGHCVALSLGDLSVWCYECSAYVHHPSLNAIVQHVENLKFGGPAETKKPAATNS